MKFVTSTISMGLAIVALLAVTPATAQLDPALPPNAADSLASRLAQRRTAQLATQPPVAPFGASQPPPSVEPDAVLKKKAPVLTGNDPTAIEDGNRIITQIIPVQNLSAAQVVNELRGFISADADLGTDASSNCVIITDTSAKVRRLVELLQDLDRVAATHPVPLARPQAARTPPPMPAEGVIVGDVISPVETICAGRAGTIAEILVKPGQHVLKGDVLFRFDARRAQFALESAQHEVAALESQLQGRADVSSADNIKLAEARTQTGARALDVEECTIKAPFDGNLELIDVHAGSQVAAWAQLTRLVNPDEMEVRFHLHGAAMPNVSVGQRLIAKRWPAGDGETTVTVTYVSPELDPSFDPVVISAKPVNPADLKPGMTVTLAPATH